LALKHLVSLQAPVRPSVQAELDLHTEDKLERGRERGKESEGERVSERQRGRVCIDGSRRFVTRTVRAVCTG
jgi:hypothetical protein